MLKITRARLKLRNTILQIAILGLCVGNRSVFGQTLPIPNHLIQFNSPEGEKLFLDSSTKEDFWDLSVQFVTQNNQAYCGVASMIMVLNSLGIPAPEASQYSPFRVFTQENFFNSVATRQILSPEVVARQGMTLDQLGQLLKSYQVQVKVFHASETTEEEFRRLASENLGQSGNFVLVNYLRKEIGQETGGHISPLTAYDKQSDRFLILDVSRYKYPPVWVKTADLWKAMGTTDKVSGKTRGFLFVSRNQ